VSIGSGTGGVEAAGEGGDPEQGRRRGHQRAEREPDGARGDGAPRAPVTGREKAEGSLLAAAIARELSAEPAAQPR
jgi:hypothetical protein